jgi:hypothetical protein
LPEERSRYGYPILAINSYGVGLRRDARTRVWEGLTDGKPKGTLRWTKTRGVQRYARLAVRLLKMSPAELGRRIQLATKRRVWKSFPAGSTALHYLPPNHSQLGAKLVERRQLLLQRLDRCFSFDSSGRSNMKARLARDFPTLVENIVHAADRIMHEEVVILGQSVRLMPGVLDWQADPISRRRLWPATRIDEAEAISSSSGDAKYVWEVNRHQFLPTLVRAYWLTGKESYLERVASLIDDWIDNNPCGTGVNWCSHLEVSMRAISWLWTLPIMLRWGRIQPAFLRKWLSSFAQHHAHLSQNLSVYTDPTNHLIGEATGLWMLSLCFPEFDDRGTALAKTEGILTREIARQVASDGVGKEQATSYQRFVLEFYLQFIILSQRTNRQLAQVVVTRVERMLEFVAALAGIHGNSPMIGDSDDARGFPGSQPSGWDYRDLLSTGAVLFRRADWKARAGELADTAIWMLGTDAIEQFAALPAQIPTPQSMVFPEGGYCFFASRTAAGDAELIFDTGALGLWPNAAHGHADALSIQLRINGKFLLNDPGTGTYFSDSLVRNNFRRTAAHNTVTVDGLDQADIYDVFKWVNPMLVRFEEHYSGADFDYAVASHDGYRRLRHPVTHRRTVLFVKPYGFLIIDGFDGKERHTFTRHFNFDPAVTLHYNYPSGVTAVHKESLAAARIALPESHATGLCTPQLDHYGGWSSRYGQWSCAPRFKVETEGHPPMALVTVISLLAQEQQSNSPTEQGQVLEADGALLWEGSFTGAGDGAKDWLVINPQRLDLTLMHKTQTNAPLAYLRRQANGSIERVFMVGEGAYLTADDVKLSNTNTCYASLSRPRLVAVQEG